MVNQTINTCVIIPDKGLYSETFIRAQIERLPCKTTYLYGGLFPMFREDGRLLVKPLSLTERSKRAVLSRIFHVDYAEQKMKNNALCEYFKENNIHAVLAEFGEIGACVMDACQQSGMPLIVHFHGYDAYEKQTLNKFAEKYKEMFHKADAIIAVSKAMKNQLIALGAPEDKVHYIVSGYDHKRFNAADPLNAPPIFLCAGRFTDKKGPLLTLIAFSKVLLKVPQAKLVMAGDGPLHDAAISLAKALKIDANVDFTGVIAHDEFAHKIRQVRAFVQHSRVPLNGDSEGTPVSIMEASGSGLPVISTFHAGIPEIVDDQVSGYLVQEGDVDRMADYMIKIALDPHLAQKMGKAGKIKMQSSCTLDLSIAKLWQVIKTSIDKKQGQS